MTDEQQEIIDAFMSDFTVNTYGVAPQPTLEPIAF
jgi:hypothetical protein